MMTRWLVFEAYELLSQDERMGRTSRLDQGLISFCPTQTLALCCRMQFSPTMDHFDARIDCDI